MCSMPYEYVDYILMESHYVIDDASTIKINFRVSNPSIVYSEFCMLNHTLLEFCNLHTLIKRLNNGTGKIIFPLLVSLSITFSACAFQLFYVYGKPQFTSTPRTRFNGNGVINKQLEKIANKLQIKNVDPVAEWQHFLYSNSVCY